MTARGALLSAVLLAAAMIATTGPACADVPAGNLLVNGDAEQGTGTSNDVTTSPVPIPGWTTTPSFTEYIYAQPGSATWVPSTSESANINGGAQFFAGGPHQGVGLETAKQDVPVSEASSEIDAGSVSATLAAVLGGPDGGPAKATLTATFLSSSSVALGTITLGPVPTQGADGALEIAPFTGTVIVPSGTRMIEVTMTADDTGGSGGTADYNKAFFDDVRLTLQLPPEPPLPSSGPPPPPRASSSPRPVLGRKVNAAPVSGTVLVKLPDNRSFTKLTSLSSIPMGSLVNATHGVVSLVSATDRKGHTTHGRFWAGEFRITQSASRGHEITVLTLQGALPAACRNRCSRPAVAISKPPPRRSLWGSASGNFRTVGRFGSATERGTTWLIEDTRAGTLIKVVRDVVTVDDFPHHRLLTLRAHHEFLAHPGKGG